MHVGHVTEFAGFQVVNYVDSCALKLSWEGNKTFIISNSYHKEFYHIGHTHSILDHVWGAEEPGYGLLASKILN